MTTCWLREPTSLFSKLRGFWPLDKVPIELGGHGEIMRLVCITVWPHQVDCSNHQDIWMVLSSITIPPFLDIKILPQLSHVVMSCIALELLPPLHSFIMFATLLFECLYHCMMLNQFRYLQILAHLCYNLLS